MSLLLCFVVLPAFGAATIATKAAKRNERHAVLDARERAFVARATSDDDMQITLAELAMSKSASARVRALASRIVNDHTALDLQWAPLAVNTRGKERAHGQHIRAIRSRLQSLQGAAFDLAFAGMMVKEQRKIIAAYAAAAKTSADNRLRTIAARGLPVLQGHLAATRALVKEGRPAEDGLRQH